MSVVTLKDELIDLIEEKLLPHTEQVSIIIHVCTVHYIRTCTCGNAYGLAIHMQILRS